MSRKPIPLHESIAAIAYHIGGSKNRDSAYTNGLEGVGFVGFYEVAINGAKALEKLAKRFKVTWGNSHDWLLATEFMGDQILEYMVNRKSMPTPENGLPGLAQTALQNAKDLTPTRR